MHFCPNWHYQSLICNERNFTWLELSSILVSSTLICDSKRGFMLPSCFAPGVTPIVLRWAALPSPAATLSGSFPPCTSELSNPPVSVAEMRFLPAENMKVNYKTLLFAWCREGQSKELVEKMIYLPLGFSSDSLSELSEELSDEFELLSDSELGLTAAKKAKW